MAQNQNPRMSRPDDRRQQGGGGSQQSGGGTQQGGSQPQNGQEEERLTAAEQKKRDREVLRARLKKFREQLRKPETREGIIALQPPHLRKNAAYIDAIMEGAFLATRDNLELLYCDRESMFRALARVARSGLPIGPGGYWLVPYKREVQEQLDYRGAMALVRRSGLVKKFTAQVIYDKDTCEITLGTQENVIHKVPLGDRGPWVGVYAIAWIEGVDSPEVEVMSKAQVMLIRARASDRSPAWKNDETEMARKVIIKRISKRLPKGDGFALLLRDEQVERTIEGTAEQVDDVLGIGFEDDGEDDLGFDPDTGEVRDGDRRQQVGDQTPRLEHKPEENLATMQTDRPKETVGARQEETRQAQVSTATGQNGNGNGGTAHQDPRDDNPPPADDDDDPGFSAAGDDNDRDTNLFARGRRR